MKLGEPLGKPTKEEDIPLSKKQLKQKLSSKTFDFLDKTKNGGLPQ